MGAGLASTLQLQAFRERLGIVGPVSTLWVSTTFTPEALKTVDFDPASGSTTIQLKEEDRQAAELGRRVNAIKNLGRAQGTIERSADVATEIIDEHRPGTRTLVVVNTLGRSLILYQQLQRDIGKREIPPPWSWSILASGRAIDRWKLPSC